jgi:hypothetical protein
MTRMGAARGEWFDLFSGGRDGEVLLPMLSGSMADALMPGDALKVRPLGGRKPHIGDIAVFRENGKLVAHRLILVFRLFSLSLVIEKGDANRAASRIDPRVIVGIVDSAIRNGTTISTRTPEAKEQGRRMSLRALIRYSSFELPKDCIRRMLGRDA